MKTSNEGVYEQVANLHLPVWGGTDAELRAMRRSSIQHNLGSRARRRRRLVSKILHVTEIVWEAASFAVLGLVVGAVLAIYPF